MARLVTQEKFERTFSRGLVSSAWSASGRGLGILTSNEVGACVGGQKVPGEVKKGNEVVGSAMKFLIEG